ncbi:hypothetical protein ACLOJK_010698 [Asimina triloba]
MQHLKIEEEVPIRENNKLRKKNTHASSSFEVEQLTRLFEHEEEVPIREEEVPIRENNKLRKKNAHASSSSDVEQLTQLFEHEEEGPIDDLLEDSSPHLEPSTLPSQALAPPALSL